MSQIKEKLYILKENDPYKILGVAEDSDVDEITKVYRKLAKDFHPDRHIDLKGSEKDELTQIFTKITSAFNRLKDPDERKKYDFEKRLSETKARNNTSQSSGANPSVSIKQEPNKNTDNSINFKEFFTETKVDVKDVKKKKAEDLFNSGLALYESDRNEEALTRFQSAIELNPHVAKYHSYLGLAMLKKGWNGYAMAEFKVALNFNPGDPIALKHYVPSASSGKSSRNKSVENDSGLLNKVKNLFRK